MAYFKRLDDVDLKDNIRKISNENVKRTTKEDFENVLTENGQWILLNNLKDWNKKIINEYVYGFVLKGTNKKYIIWSSIDIENDKFRDTGCDAIRIARYGRGNCKSIRVNRVDNWAYNLAKKLKDFRTNNKY